LAVLKYVACLIFFANNDCLPRKGDGRSAQAQDTRLHPASLWPSNSPDLNPVDYKIWGLLQQRVYSRKIQNVDELRQSIVEEWERLDQRVIDNAATQSNSGVDVFALVWLRRAEISSK